MTIKEKRFLTQYTNLTGKDSKKLFYFSVSFSRLDSRFFILSKGGMDGGQTGFSFSAVRPINSPIGVGIESEKVPVLFYPVRKPSHSWWG
jgi:hypothetical protein